MTKVQIEEVKEVMKNKLPECWLPLEVCLSAIGAAMLKDVDHCIGLILVGEPGGRKTTTLELLGRDAPIYLVDMFTPASFVSHDATKTEEQLKEIDLLPRIQHKILIIPEMAPIFGQRYEDLVKDIAILTRVMDGSGYLSESGTHGRRGYEGDYRFNMIGATTPLEHRAWQALGKLSSRWIFYRLEEASAGSIDLREDFSSKKELCRINIEFFLKDLWKGFGTICWNRANDREKLTNLLKFSAQWIREWRGLVQRQDSTGYNPPVVEAPHRLAETLYALARGHALLWGRQQISWEDVNFVMEVNYTNMPEDRARLFKAFDKAGFERRSEITTFADYFRAAISLREASRVLGCSTDRAKRVLDELIDLKVVSLDKKKGYYRNV